MNMLLKEAFWVQDIIKNESNTEDEIIKSSLRQNRTGCMAEKLNSIEFNWYVKWKINLKVIWICFFILFSVAFLVSQFSLFYDKEYSVFAYTI